MSGKKHAINPSKIIDVLLFDVVEYRKPRITFILDINSQLRSDKVDMYFDTYEEAAKMYKAIISEFNYIEIFNK